MVAPAKADDADKTAGIAHLKQALLGHTWHYRDSLFPPGGESFQFNENGTFHYWKWNYWVVGPREIRVHYDQNNKNSATGISFTFNEDLTKFTSEYKDPKGKSHVITGWRDETETGSTTPPIGPGPSVPSAAAKEYTSPSTGMKFALIPAGMFPMGSPASEVQRANVEGPQHTVRISQPFYLGRHEVTQGEYEQVMGSNPSRFSPTGTSSSNVSGMDTRKFPVENVSWYDAIEFCNTLSEKDSLPAYYTLTNVQRESSSIMLATVTTTSGNGYRLPTEAEWEYACRANTTTPFHFGGMLNGNQANVDGRFPYGTKIKGKSLDRTTSVGSYPANPFGLHDMHGNVREWCFDVYDESVYGKRSGTTSDPAVTSNSELRVLRGGSWNYVAGVTRTAYRSGLTPGGRVYNNGFRVVSVGARTP